MERNFRSNDSSHKNKQFKAIVGWNQHWISQDEIIKPKLKLYSSIRGPFSHPKVLKSIPFIITPSFNERKNNWSNIKEIKFEGRTLKPQKSRHGIPDLWFNYLAHKIRKSHGQHRSTQDEENEEYKAELEKSAKSNELKLDIKITRDICKKYGLLLCQGIPDPDKNVPLDNLRLCKKTKKKMTKKSQKIGNNRQSNSSNNFFHDLTEHEVDNVKEDDLINHKNALNSQQNDEELLEETIQEGNNQEETFIKGDPKLEIQKSLSEGKIRTKSRKSTKITQTNDNNDVKSVINHKEQKFYRNSGDQTIFSINRSYNDRNQRFLSISNNKYCEYCTKSQIKSCSTQIQVVEALKNCCRRSAGAQKKEKCQNYINYNNNNSFDKLYSSFEKKAKLSNKVANYDGIIPKIDKKYSGIILHPDSVDSSKKLREENVGYNTGLIDNIDWREYYLNKVKNPRRTFKKYKHIWNTIFSYKPQKTLKLNNNYVDDETDDEDFISKGWEFLKQKTNAYFRTLSNSKLNKLKKHNSSVIKDSYKNLYTN